MSAPAIRQLCLSPDFCPLYPPDKRCRGCLLQQVTDQRDELLVAAKGYRTALRPWLDAAIGRKGTVSYTDWETAVDRLEAAICKAETTLAEACCEQAPDRSGRACDRPKGHTGRHWTYGGNTLTWEGK